MKSYIYLLVACTLLSCKKDKGGDTPQLQNVNPIDLSTIDNGNRVMMQTFYWDVTPLGELVEYHYPKNCRLESQWGRPPLATCSY